MVLSSVLEEMPRQTTTTTSSEAIVAIPDSEKPLNLAKKRKFESNEQSDLNCEPFTENNISNSVTRLETDKRQHEVNHLSKNEVHFEHPETDILPENLNQLKQDW